MRIDDEVELAKAVVPLSTRPYDRLLEAIGDARFVLLGEASHGTHEFYRERATITKELIVRKGFDAIAVEADWPDAHDVHRYICGRSDARTPEEALSTFERFPRWMWRNRDVCELVSWLHENTQHVGFYGLDLYSLHASIDAVLGLLEQIDPDAAERARKRYSCFEHFGTSTDAYAYASGLGLSQSCQNQVVQQLVEAQEHKLELLQKAAAAHEEDAVFQIEMNARLVKAAEEYYRSMLGGAVVTWNLRDQHMADTLAAVAEHLERKLRHSSKIVVWAHNSHLGDARATEMGEGGELNVGQLVRERFGSDSFIVGFTTYDGTVTAAPEWGANANRVAVRPALPNSHELLLHELAFGIGVSDFVVLPEEDRHLPTTLAKERLERAIGVVYRPHTERVSHWFRARLAQQFDALVHLDRTSAVEPLVKKEKREAEDLPETYPFAV